MQIRKAIPPLAALLAIAGLIGSLAYNADEPLTSWQLLAKVKVSPGLFGDAETTFDPGIKALDQKEMSMAGYMFPLQAGSSVRRFILSAKPPTCSTCMPGGSEAMVLVNSPQPIKVSTERMHIKGQFKIAQEMGLFYRLDMPIKVVQ
ncbi:hypothetical protein [Iodobacter sp.]|uniref:hypothetical protein n=1 Tax=Iodobacter sp. TaxID=1915058 RepID=UPI0025E02669|nr:hypothetical protein [Iodobacter sp.]